MRVLPHLSPLLALALVLLLPACQSSNRYRHWTNPIEILAPEGSAAPEVRALLSVRGANHFEEEGPLEMHVRLRVDNRGERPLRLVADRLSLVTADLVDFGSARAQPLDETPAGATLLYDLYFEFPAEVSPNDLDLSAVTVSLGLDDGERMFLMTATFEQLPPGARYDPDQGGLFFAPAFVFST